MACPGDMKVPRARKCERDEDETTSRVRRVKALRGPSPPRVPQVPKPNVFKNCMHKGETWNHTVTSFSGAHCYLYT